MINAGYATLDQRPEVLDIVSVNLPSNVDFGTVLNPFMLVAKPCYVVITRKFISVKNRIGGYIFCNKRDNGRPFDIGNGGSHDPALSLDYPDNSNLALGSSASFAVPNTADIGFVNFNFASKDRIGFAKQSPDLFEHSPSRFISNTSFPLNLLRRDTTSGRCHSVNNLKPSPQRRSRLMKDSTRSRINLVVAIVTVIAWAISKLMMLGHSLANWALNALRPAMVFNPFKASIVIRKSLVKVFDGKLVHSLDFRHFVHCFIPHLQVLYHKSYLLSRDSCLI